jgi:hypothetical protein
MYDVSPTRSRYMAAGLAVVANDQPDQKLVLEQSKTGLHAVRFAGVRRGLG